jgi:hypothetical protein
VSATSRSLAILLAALVVAACTSGTPSSPSAGGVDPAAAGVIAQYGHRATGPTRRTPIVLDLASEQWALPLEVSRSVGLDFGALEGRSAELLFTPIAGREPDASLVVLTVEGRLVGTWIAPGSMVSGVLPVDEHP